jgi:protein gp37
MSANSSIEWTDATWNPVRGCTKISAGCKHCYAETFAERWRGIPNHPYEQGFDLTLVPHKLSEPITWRRSRRIFVNSMSDLFHEGIPREYIGAVIDVMRLANWHIYQVLTKRAERMRAILSRPEHGDLVEQRHLWFGVSVENRRHGIPRIEALRQSPVAVRFLSVEPLLEDLGTIDLTGIDWVIVGGESGRGARPMKKEWVLSIQQQCAEHSIPFFFKQWGGVQKKRFGRELEGRTFDELPAIDPEPPPSASEQEEKRHRVEEVLQKVA